MILSTFGMAARGAATQTPHGSMALDVTQLPASQAARALHLDASIAAAAAQLNPTQAAEGTRQLLVLRVEVAGQPVAPEMIESWSIELRPEGTTWSMVFPADEVRDTIGWEVDHYGYPPPGPGGLYVALEYGQPALTYVLLDRGIPDAASREVRPELHRLPINGSGLEARYDRTRITYQLDAHHGKTHGQMIRESAALLGVPASGVDIGSELGSARANAVDLDDIEGWPAMQEMAAAMGRVLRFDAPTSKLVAPLAVPDTDPEITFEFGDLVAVTGLSCPDATSERLTCLVVEGVRATRSTDRAGVRTTTKEIETYGPLALPHAYWIQLSTGVLSATTNPGPYAEKEGVLLSRVRVIETKVDGCLKIRRTETYRHGSPVIPRYQVADPGTVELTYNATYPPSGANAQIYEADAVQDDQSQSYRYAAHRFYLQEVDEEVYDRDAAGRLIQKQTRRGRWRFNEMALKTRALSATPWESTVHIANRYTTGDGRGCGSNGDLFYGTGPARQTAYSPTSTVADAVDPGELTINKWAEVDTTSYTLTDDNYIQQETTVKEAWTLRAGDKYLFAGGRESSGDQEIGLVTQTSVTSYVPDGNNHTKITAETNALDGRTFTKIEPVEGYLPAADICTGELLDAKESQPWETRVCAPRPGFQTWDERVSPPYVETPEEGTAYAAAVLTQDAAITLRFSVLINAALRPKMSARVEFGEWGWQGDGWIEAVRHGLYDTEDGQAMLTEVEFKLRVI